MTAEVTAVSTGSVDLCLEGAVQNIACGTWAVHPFVEPLAETERGFDCRLQGYITVRPVPRSVRPVRPAGGGDALGRQRAHCAGMIWTPRRWAWRSSWPEANRQTGHHPRGAIPITGVRPGPEPLGCAVLLEPREEALPAVLRASLR